MVQTINTISLGDVAWSMFKTMLFAILIAGTGCFRGFQVRGGADAVGRATTSSVVTSIFLIILADSILAVIQRYWG
jgi:phospholipid/cholesterol/gamma-HCH transport system permease protein